MPKSLLIIAAACATCFCLILPASAQSNIPRPSHHVQPGDSLPAIAARYGLTVAELMNATRIQRESHLIPGQILLLPAGAIDKFPARHIVQAGESLRAIATLYSLDWQTLAQVNSISDPNRIAPGQALAVPMRIATPPQTTTAESAPAPAPRASSSSPATTYNIYIAQPGDTFENLAERYARSFQALLALNSLRGESRLYPGELVLLPPAPEISAQRTAATHIVRVGETLASIAAQYGRNMWDIAAANGLLNPDLIAVGQILLIP